LERLGLIRKDGREHFLSSIVIPLFDEAGAGGGGDGRGDKEQGPGAPGDPHLPGARPGGFNRSAVEGGRELILCEALIDALTFWCAGFTNVSSSYGVSGFTPELLTAIKEHHVERVLIAYDRDAAGDEAAHELAKKLKDEGVLSYRVN